MLNLNQQFYFRITYSHGNRNLKSYILKIQAGGFVKFKKSTSNFFYYVETCLLGLFESPNPNSK